MPCLSAGKPAEVIAAFDTIKEQLGHPEVLIYNAGPGGVTFPPPSNVSWYLLSECAAMSNNTVQIAAAAHKRARQIFTINMATAGALDLKPEVFEGAFSSGVVGALTASQQVTLPSSAFTFTMFCRQLNDIVCFSIWEPHFRRTVWTRSHSCQLPSSACCSIYNALNSTPWPTLQCSNNAGLATSTA